ncbi:MAG: hypothetical protein JWQ42_4997 [Edaphobacter sp.]|nr:hypothetical protein [Edaphobacter sp.]
MLLEGRGSTSTCPAYASELQARVAFVWPAMDAFYEEDERIVGHAADSYHRIDIRQTSRRLMVRHHDRIIADTKRPVVLYESGFASRWYIARADVDECALTPVEHQTFCPYKGLCSYYEVDGAHLAAWSYRDAYPQVGRISGLVRSSRTSSRYRSMAPSSVLGRVRQDSTRPRSRPHYHPGAPSCQRLGRSHQRVRHGSTTIGECWTSARHQLEGSHCTHRDLEGSSARALPGRPVESGRRRSR